MAMQQLHTRNAYRERKIRIRKNKRVRLPPKLQRPNYCAVQLVISFCDRFFLFDPMMVLTLPPLSFPSPFGFLLRSLSYYPWRRRRPWCSYTLYTLQHSSPSSRLLLLLRPRSAYFALSLSRDVSLSLQPSSSFSSSSSEHTHKLLLLRSLCKKKQTKTAATAKAAAKSEERERQRRC